MTEKKTRSKQGCKYNPYDARYADVRIDNPQNLAEMRDAYQNGQLHGVLDYTDVYLLAAGTIPHAHRFSASIIAFHYHGVLAQAGQHDLIVTDGSSIVKRLRSLALAGFVKALEPRGKHGGVGFFQLTPAALSLFGLEKATGVPWCPITRPPGIRPAFETAKLIPQKVQPLNPLTNRPATKVHASRVHRVVLDSAIQALEEIMALRKNNELTTAQKELLKIYVDQWRRLKTCPSLREAAALYGTSYQAVHYQSRVLEEKGYLTVVKFERRPRSPKGMRQDPLPTGARRPFVPTEKALALDAPPKFNFPKPLAPFYWKKETVA